MFVHPDRMKQINAVNEKQVCRDHLHGNCTRTNCKFIHSERETTNICRDHLHNKCTRTNCKFIHVENNNKKDTNKNSCRDHLEDNCTRTKCKFSHSEIKELTPKNICRDFMNKKCVKDNCKFIHNTRLCKRFWKNGSCKFKDNCKKEHLVTINTNPYYLVKEEKKLHKNIVLTNELTIEQFSVVLEFLQHNQFIKQDMLLEKGHELKLHVSYKKLKEPVVESESVSAVVVENVSAVEPVTESDPVVESVVDPVVESVVESKSNLAESELNEFEFIEQKMEHEEIIINENGWN